MSSISTIRNLGPASVVQFAKAGITSTEESQDMGATAKYRRCLRAGISADFIS